MPIDEQGNIVAQTPAEITTQQEMAAVAPPGYGEHLLDQLYENVDPMGFQTPAIHSGVSSPFYSQSRTGSYENMAQLTDVASVHPAALSSRLADVSIDPSQRNMSYGSLHSTSGRVSPSGANNASAPRSELHSNELSRSNSEENSSRNSAEGVHIDMSEFAELNRVPSYATAVRTPARSRANTGADFLPDYVTALSAPRTPPATDMRSSNDTLAPISEDEAGEARVPNCFGRAAIDANTPISRSPRIF